jgi:hypothetical protein
VSSNPSSTKTNIPSPPPTIKNLENKNKTRTHGIGKRHLK